MAQLGAVAPRTFEEADADAADLTPVRTYWQLARRRFLRNRLAVAGLVVLAMLVVASVVIPAMTGDAWRTALLAKVNAPPAVGPAADGSFELAPLGYSDIGQNVFARVAKATGTSLSIGFAAVVIIVGLGVSIGSVAGYFGGWVDNVLMRLVDVVLSLPGLFIILALVSFWGGGSIWVIIVAIGITSWTLAARLVRAEFLRLREVDYVQAARALGASSFRIMLRHMLPPAMAPIIVAATLGVADSVVIEAALSFLGFGISQPEASLGNMLTEARTYFFRNPMLVVWPGLVLVAIVMSASFLGDGLRDALDPRQR
ncbi:MAG TPA: ABC transporter permease [Candidatus Limnocylindria bacterium]|nr:ABC transporter permease [Candidatus Limnocylindria bacterium]